METHTRVFCRKRPSRAVGSALPLAAALLWQALLPAAAHEAATFARPQLADVIASAQPAVVKIEVVKAVGLAERRHGRGPAVGRGVPFEEFFGRPGHALPAEPPARATGVGSGFIVDPSGYVVTNDHVIDGAEDIQVTLNDGRRAPARLVGHDPLTDLALLEIDFPEPLPALAFGDSERARVGDWVVAIGSPFGLGGSVTAGIISARGRDLEAGPYDDYLQIDAPINSGSSGGPVLGADGKVLGVNTAIYSPTGGNIGIGFAVPARDAQLVVEALRAEGVVTRGWLGVQIQPLTAELAEALGLASARGALVAAVLEAGPAARAGLAVGDVITRYDDVEIADARALPRVVARSAPGREVVLEVLRQGRARRLSALVERQGEAEASPIAQAAGDATDAEQALGLALGPLSDADRARLALGDEVRGALVLGVERDGSAAAGGLEPGDVIVQVGRTAVTDAARAARALNAAIAAKRPAALLVRRGQEQFFTTLGRA